FELDPAVVEFAAVPDTDRGGRVRHGLPVEAAVGLDDSKTATFADVDQRARVGHDTGCVARVGYRHVDDVDRLVEPHSVVGDDDRVVVPGGVVAGDEAIGRGETLDECRRCGRRWSFVGATTPQPGR